MEVNPTLLCDIKSFIYRDVGKTQSYLVFFVKNFARIYFGEFSVEENFARIKFREFLVAKNFARI